ncbi:MAG: hypothetical protein R2731_13665 [Nocardioides sp.]
MLTAQRAVLAADRGDPAALALAASTRRYWDVEGLVALLAGYAEQAVHESRVDPRAAAAGYDATVALLAGLWRPWFGGRLRLASLALGTGATAAVRQSAAERAAWAREAERLHEDGRHVLAGHREAGS